MTSPILTMSGVSKSYGRGTQRLDVLQDVNLTVEPGEFVTIVGFSGAGKTTLVSLLAGLQLPDAGEIQMRGQRVTQQGPDRGVVFQSPCLLPWLTALENVLLGVDSVMAYLPKADRIEVAAYFLELVGLGDSLNRRAKELSQGMQQRVGIARAFAISPKMLLLDEPFGMLDSLTRMELQEVLLELLARGNMTTLMVTPDVDEALFLSDRIVMMTNGPNAKVGEILSVPFDCPRERKAVVTHASYYELRERMLVFLDEQKHLKHGGAGISGGSGNPDVPKTEQASHPFDVPHPSTQPTRESSNPYTHHQAVATVGESGIGIRHQ